MGVAADATPDVEERFLLALARAAHEALTANGLAWLYTHKIIELAREIGLSDRLLDHSVERLVDRGLLWEKDSRSHYEALPLAVFYEEHVDRREFWRSNAVRRELLELAAREDEQGRRLEFREGPDNFTSRPWEEAVAAARVLAHWGLVDLHENLGHSFSVRLATEGFDLLRDESRLRRELPLEASDDEEAHEAIAPDVLAEVITSCEELLSRRGWSGAAAELRRGDEQYRAAHWVDAVSEYYSAVESGFKHLLDEAGVTYSSGAGLRDLARLAADNALIPANYQALFTFLDSVRSPRRHGRGSRPQEVPVGPAEALLMANHARSLLVYLGHRPHPS